MAAIKVSNSGLKILREENERSRRVLEEEIKGKQSMIDLDSQDYSLNEEGDNVNLDISADLNHYLSPRALKNKRSIASPKLSRPSSLNEISILSGKQSTSLLNKLPKIGYAKERKLKQIRRKPDSMDSYSQYKDTLTSFEPKNLYLKQQVNDIERTVRTKKRLLKIREQMHQKVPVEEDYDYKKEFQLKRAIEFYYENMKKGVDLQEFYKEIRGIQKLDKIEKNYKKVNQTYRRRMKSIRRHHQQSKIISNQSLRKLFKESQNILDHGKSIINGEKKKNSARFIQNDFLNLKRIEKERSVQILRNINHFRLNKIRSEYSKSLLTNDNLNFVKISTDNELSGLLNEGKYGKEQKVKKEMSDSESWAMNSSRF